MANALLTPQVIAREALATLYAQTVMLPLVHKDWSSDFAGVGDTITIRKPATFTVDEFDPVAGIDIQDIVEDSTSIVMNRHHDVSVEVTSKQLTLDIADLSTQVIQPMMEAHAQAIDTALLGMAAGVYNTVGTAGTAMATVAPILAARRILNTNNIPFTNRALLVDPYSAEKLLATEVFLNASWNEKSNGTALSEASLGRKYGFDAFEAAHPYEHSKGTVAFTGSLVTNGVTAVGASAISIDATTVTGSMTAGTILTIAGQNYVTTGTVAAAGNALALSISPEVAVEIADGTAVVIGTNHTASLAFHRDAFAFVSRPLAIPRGAASAEIVNYKGLGLRVIYDYDVNLKKDIISIDLLFGLKVIRPEAAVRILSGAS